MNPYFADDDGSRNHSKLGGSQMRQTGSSNPNRVKKGRSGDHPDRLSRLCGEGSLEPISWDEFFKKFDESELARVYQEETASGERSNFNKLVRRDGARE